MIMDRKEPTGWVRVVGGVGDVSDPSVFSVQEVISRSFLERWGVELTFEETFEPLQEI